VTRVIVLDFCRISRRSEIPPPNGINLMFPGYELKQGSGQGLVRRDPEGLGGLHVPTGFRKKR